MNKSIWQKRLPTFIGIGILVIALMAGVYVTTIGGGPGVFAPRATAETTPQKIKVTNITDSSFTISFVTSDKTAGFVKYGEEENSTKSQASDDRDQLSGSVGEFNVHHITVRGLQANTTYYYLLGTGSRNTFDNNGQAFKVTTTKRSGAPSAAKTAYGNVLNESGGPAEGSVVYVTIEGVGEMSSLVKNSGSWAIPLSNARTSDGSGYATLTDDQTMLINVQGPAVNSTSSLTTTIAQSQPVPTITLGQNNVSIVPDNTMTSDTNTTSLEATAMEDTTMTASDSTETMMTDSTASDSAGTSGELTSLLADTPASTTNMIVDTDLTTEQKVATSQPTIKGKAAPNVTVNIEVHSDTTITQEITADENGEFVLDISKLSQNLEPGEHTVTYTYTDPNTGKEVTKTTTFTVEDPSANTQLASTTTTSTSGPYGTGNPYPMEGTASASPSPTPKATASSSSTIATRSSQPATSSSLPVSGSVSTTLVLLVGGLFFIIAGGWSFWIANELKEERYPA